MGQFFDKVLYQNKDNNVIPTLPILNLRRIRIISVLLLLFQFFSLFGDHVKEYPAIRTGLLVTTVLSVVVLIVTTIVLKLNWSDEKICIYCILYWSFFTLQMTPYFITDVIYSDSPINYALFACALAMVPVFAPKTVLIMYPVFFIYASLMYFLSGADAELYSAAIVFGLGGITLAYINQASFHRMYERLKTSSETDALTGLFNKATGEKLMQAVLPLCKRDKNLVTIFFMDIDYFKNYNDTYGHLAGDEVLKQVADNIRGILVRKTDIVARIGGEEFIMMLVGTTSNDAIRLARRLLSRVESMNIPSGHGATRDHLTISIGVVTEDVTNSECDEKTLFDMINTADQMLYKAKASGRNCVATEFKTYGPEK